MWRSLFFVPANRLDLIAKLPRFDADNCVLDLEDATPVEHKPQARRMLGEAVRLVRDVGIRGRLLVRVNGLATEYAPADLETVAGLDIDGVVLPKASSACELGHVAASLAAGATGGRERCIVAGIESIEGVLDAAQFLRAGPRPAAIYFGAEDLAAEAGILRTPGSSEVQHARQSVLLAAKAAGAAAIDQAVTQVKDPDLFAADARAGRGFGYDGKICLTPAQVEQANRLFTPDAQEAYRARRLVAAFEESQRLGKGTFAFEGQMIDEPLVRRARAILSAYEAATRL